MFIARQTGVRGPVTLGPGGRSLLLAQSVARSMPEISEAIEVPASPTTVWAVLTEIDAYAPWNTLLSVRGDLSVGERVDVRLSMPGLPTVPLSPEITSVEPERALRLRSRLFGVEA